jgi:hypothetical protein
MLTYIFAQSKLGLGAQTKLGKGEHNKLGEGKEGWVRSGFCQIDQFPQRKLAGTTYVVLPTPLIFIFSNHCFFWEQILILCL